MKNFKNFFSNISILALLLILGLGLALFLRNRLPAEKPAAQATDTTPPSITSTVIVETETPVSTPAETETPTPADVTLTPTGEPVPPQDDTPEPTWTPAIIEPEGTPPPIPSPPPTPTPTPLNPKESTIAVFDVPVYGLAVAPDDNALALFANTSSEQGNSIPQIWTLDLSSKQIKDLNISGRTPLWSPNGQKILYWNRQDDQIQVEVINAEDGSSKESLDTLNQEEFLNYYWDTSDQVSIIKPDGVHRVNLASKTKEHKNLSIPAKTRGGTKSQVIGHPNGVIAIADGHDLLVTQPNGQSVTITDTQGRSIGEFVLSPNGQQLAYVVNEGRNDELWTNNIAGTSPQMLYRIEGGHIHDLVWTPNNQAVVIGWRETGTYLGAELILLWLDVKKGGITPLQVHGVDQGFVFNHKGDRLFYGRTFYNNSTDEGETTLYQLEVE